MLRTRIAAMAAASLALAASAGTAAAQEVLKLGMVQSLTGAFNTVGKAAVNGAQLYLQQHGDTVAGRKIQLIIKDDATAPDAAKRLAQELIVNDKVAILAVGITPSALTIAPLATEAKIPTVVLVSGASVTVERSPYMVRTSFTLAQSSAIIADWAVKNGAKKVVTLVNDWAPGLEAEAASRIAPPRAACRSSNRCGCRSPIRTSHRSCSARGTAVPIRSSSMCPATRPVSSPSSSLSAASTSPASASSVPATSPTTTSFPA
jgi:hypothetical protein